MLKSLSTAATGMQAQQTRLDVTANNIANVSTPGFKKSRAEFQDLLYQTTLEPGAATGSNTRAPTGLQVGMGVRISGTQRDHSEGELSQTSNPLDIAIGGNGFYAIKLPTGEQAYTRAGSFKLDQEGKIVTADGYSLANEITVPADAMSVAIAADGTITAKVPNNATPVELGKMQLANFVNPTGLSSMGRNMFMETAASGTPILGSPGENGLGTLSQGTLELSNVSVVQEMIDLIAGQRAYDVNSRVIKAADEMLQETAALR